MSEENENLITDKMVKKATYYIHKLATRRGADFKDIQKKCRQRLGYTNLAKVTLDEGHVIINKLIEWTGGEEEETEREAEPKDDLSLQLPTKPDSGFGRSAANAEPIERAENLEKESEHEEELKDNLSISTKTDENMGATVTDDGTTAKEIVEPKKEEEKSREDEDLVTSTMRKAVRAAVNITLDEVVEKEVPVQGLGGFVLRLTEILFEAQREDTKREQS